MRRAILICTVLLLVLCKSGLAAVGGGWVPSPRTTALVGKTGNVSGKLKGDVLPETSVLVHGSDRHVRGVSVRKDGTFEILQLPAPGMYTLSVANAMDYYCDVRVMLDLDGQVDSVLVVESTLGKLVKQNSNYNKGSMVTGAKHAKMVLFEPVAPVTYEIQKPSMEGILTYLKKPIVILLLLAAVMVTILPYFADSLDPETYAELFGDRRPRPGKPADVYVAAVGLARPDESANQHNHKTGYAGSREPQMDASQLSSQSQPKTAQARKKRKPARKS